MMTLTITRLHKHPEDAKKISSFGELKKKSRRW